MVNVSSAYHHLYFFKEVVFEAYVQFEEYTSFMKAMDFLRNMKLVKVMADGKQFEALINVSCFLFFQPQTSIMKKTVL